MSGGEAMMQILELVIYSYDGRRRQIKFNLGSVNIITGKSKSGKSVVGEIIAWVEETAI